MAPLRKKTEVSNKPRPRVRARRTIVCVLVVALLSTGILAWQAGSVLVVSRQLPDVDAIVSLGSHEWERLPLTAVLAGRYPNAVVVLTVPMEVTPFNCHDCGHRVDRLHHAGVALPRLRILRLNLPGTHGEAVATLGWAREAHIRRLMVVTSPYHSRRALATFRSVFQGAGVDIGIEPASATSEARPSRWWFTPYDRWYVTYEWAAMIYYALKYGIIAIQ